MKRQFLFAVGLLLAGLISANAFAQVSSIRISIRQPLKGVFQNGVAIEIQVTNTSNEDVELSQPADLDISHDKDYHIDITDSQGRRLPELPTHLNRIFNTHSGPVTIPVSKTRVVVTIKPGDSIYETATLSNICDMSAPGRYTVEVFRYLGSSGDLKASSNQLTVNVK